MQNKINDSNYNIFDAPIDSTLYFFNPNGPKTDDNFAHCLRVAGPYTVKHLPWQKSFISSLDPEDADGWLSEKYNSKSNTVRFIKSIFK